MPREYMMKMLLVALAVLVAVAGGALFVRFRYYRNWTTFFDDLGEQILLDFIPGPIKVLVIAGLGIWGIASLVTLFTQDVRAKTPDPAVVVSAPDLNQLAEAANNASKTSVPAAGSGQDLSTLSTAVESFPPPPIPTSTATPAIEQLEQVSHQLEEMQRKAQQLAVAATPVPPLQTQRKVRSQPTLRKPPVQVQVTPVPDSSAASENALQQLLSGSPGSEKAGSGGRSGARQGVAYTTYRPSVRSKSHDVRSVDPNDSSRRIYSLVQTVDGDFFEGMVLRGDHERQWFLRSNGDIVRLQRRQVAYVYQKPVTWPLPPLEQ